MGTGKAMFDKEELAILKALEDDQLKKSKGVEFNPF
jgi:hypothetical protein